MREREQPSCGGAILDKLGDIVDLGKGISCANRIGLIG